MTSSLIRVFAGLGGLFGLLLPSSSAQGGPGRTLLGPGSVIPDVEFRIVADGQVIPPFMSTLVLPEGRTSRTLLGDTIYTAVLEEIPVKFGGGGFSIAPTIHVRTHPSGVQRVRMGAAYNNRTGGMFDSANTDFRLKVQLAVSGKTVHLSDRIFTSCLDGATPVTLEDGSEVPIREVVEGDRVLNPLTGATMEVEQVIRGPERIPLVRASAGGATLRMSEGHPVLAGDRFVAARDLAAGTRIGTEAEPLPVVACDRAPLVRGQLVYNLRFAGDSEDPRDHVFLAAGVPVGDWWAQDRLAAGDASALPAPEPAAR